MKYSFIVLMVVAAACGGKHTEEGEGDEWKEMEEFHMIMADVYHPVKDSQDLVPIKSGAGNLAAAATKWAQAKLPAKVDNEETKVLLAKLEDGAKDLAGKINTATDDEIAAQLTSLHDIFHEIMESWYSAGKEADHHDH